MNILLNFSIQNGKYVCYELDSNIYLAKYENKSYVKISNEDSIILKKIINKLVSEELFVYDLREYNISFFDSKTEKIPNFNDNTSIKLDLSINSKEIFMKNCEYIRFMNKGSSNHTFDYKYLIPIVVLIILAIGIYLIVNNIFSSKNNSYLLEKYAYVRDEANIDFYNQPLSVQNISFKEGDNLLSDSYLSFANPYSGFYFKTEVKGMDANIYADQYENSFVIWYIEDMYSTDRASTSYYDEEIKATIKETKGISVDEVFGRNNINSNLDLIYNVILHSKKEVTSDSSEEEIIDYYVFEAYWPLVMPVCNEFVFFTGDVQGYSCSSDNQISIELKNGNASYRIIYDYNNLDKISMLTEEQLVDLVSTIKFNK